MTEDQIVELANKHGISAFDGDKEVFVFVYAIQQSERNACAKLCEQQEAYGPLCEIPEECAAAIRARSEK
jgi:hypothetical protein